MLSTEELLRKATLTTADFGGPGEAPLSVEQVTTFIELMSNEQVLLNDVRTVSSSSEKWQESIIDFAARIARPGTQGTRLEDSDRAKPALGIVEISTVLLRGEVPITDEVLEDQVAGASFANSLERTIASRFGFDVEDLMFNGDVSSADPYLAQFDGWAQQAVDNGNAVDASTYGQDYQEIFRVLLNNLPDRFKRNLEVDGRYYLPIRTEEKWRDILSARGTSLGDLTLTGKNELRYQGILIKGVPSMGIDGDDESHILLTNRNNLYAGYHRKMRFETFRDPREGATSFIITARVDAKIAVPEATAVAYNVDVSI